MIAVPIPLIRRRMIIKRLEKCKAFSKETAVTFEEAGILRPHGFSLITRRLLASNVIAMVGEDRYYLV